MRNVGYTLTVVSKAWLLMTIGCGHERNESKHGRETDMAKELQVEASMRELESGG